MLSPGGPVPEDQAVEPGVLLTHVPDLQRVVLVQPQPLQALVHRPPVFVPAHAAGRHSRATAPGPFGDLRGPPGPFGDPRGPSGTSGALRGPSGPSGSSSHH
ncbi:hypothetical protein EYF80_063834 [Liparis tanakae]|uniref:Uncharacterized protein n=1 Tax=Liparis tanakae TaxID=230148 RepID=A0A4Z2EBT5_9TELE|nr:hypothetical protein EYF80_063834 [Liparis tanakae]